MTIGWCLFHNREIDPDELRKKSCKKKQNSGKKCRHLMLISTKDKYYNSNKGVRKKMICPYNPKVKACSNNSYDDCQYCQKNYLLVSKKLERTENSTDELIEIFEWFKGRKLGSNEKERIRSEIERGNFRAIKEAYYPKY